MAKQKKRVSVHKKASSQRTKARTRIRSSKTAAKRASRGRPKKVAKRVGVPPKAKKQAGKVRALREASKKAVPRPTEPSTQPAEVRDETVIVDMIEEPLPGVVVVTEFETVRTRRVTPASLAEATEDFGIAEGQEEEE